MRKVLVTGANGFIGRHVLEVLQARSVYEIHALTLGEPPVDSKNTVWHRVDLLDVGQVEMLMKTIRPDLLLHFAWYTAPGKYWTSDKNIVWQKASIALIKRFYENGGQRMVGAGTCAEYAWSLGILFEENTPLEPATLYGQSKLRVGTFLKEYCQEHGKSSAWGRVFFLYGPYEDSRRLMPSVICSLLQNKPALCTHGEQIRDFLYVKDVASAFVALLESHVTGPVNISSGVPVALREVVIAVADCLGAGDQVKFGALVAPRDEWPLIVGNNRRLTEEVGCRPDFDLGSGMAETVRYWKEMRKE